MVDEDRSKCVYVEDPTASASTFTLSDACVSDVSDSGTELDFANDLAQDLLNLTVGGGKLRHIPRVHDFGELCILSSDDESTGELHVSGNNAIATPTTIATAASGITTSCFSAADYVRTMTKWLTVPSPLCKTYAHPRRDARIHAI